MRHVGDCQEDLSNGSNMPDLPFRRWKPHEWVTRAAAHA